MAPWLKRLKSDRGQAMAEFAVAFPLQLLITLGIVQLCLVIVGAIVVDYAAKAAARAELVGEDPHQAAAFVCSPIAGSTWNAVGAQDIRVPGWGHLNHSQQALAKTRVTIETPLYGGGFSGQLNEVMPLDTPTSHVVAHVEHDFELIIPVIDAMGNFVFGGRKVHGARHITLRATAIQQVPWATEPRGQGHKPIPDMEEYEGGGGNNGGGGGVMPDLPDPQVPFNGGN